MSDLFNMINNMLGSPPPKPRVININTCGKGELINIIQNNLNLFSMCESCDKIIIRASAICPMCHSYRTYPVPYETSELLTTDSNYIDYSIFIE
jgi:hypothetical protein